MTAPKMARPKLFGYVQLGFLATTLAGVGVLVFEVDAVERRLAQQAGQLRALGESNDKLSAQVERLGKGGVQVKASAARADEYADVAVKHPEVPNLLHPRTPPEPPAGANTDGVLIREWDSGDPKGFNPLTENAGDLVHKIEHYVISQLAERDGWGDPSKWWGDLAWRVEVTDDYKELTAYLRKGVQWHTASVVDTADPKYKWLAEPHPLTAHDVVFTFNLVTNPQVENGAAKHVYKEFESVEALDEYTVRFRWKKKQYSNISAVLESEILPEFLYGRDERGEKLPPETVGLRFNQHWYANKGVIGSGPYRFASYKPGSEIRLVRNDAYYGVAPAIREIRYAIYSDPNQTVVKLKAKEMTMARLSPGAYREEVQKWQSRPKAEWPKNSPFLDGTLHCQAQRDFAYGYVGWNADKPMFADKRVRRAMTHALNREAIIRDVYVGLGEVALGPFLPTSPYLDPSVKALPFDLEKAKALLAEAGWVDRDGDGIVEKSIGGATVPFEFSLLFWSSPEHKAAANVYKDDLLKIGVKLNPEPSEWSLLQKKMDERKFDAIRAGWYTGSWEEDPYQLWHSSQADVPKGSNRVGFRNPEVDKLIDELRGTFEDEKRIPMLRRIHVILDEEQPYTFFSYSKRVECMDRHIQGFSTRKITPLLSTLPWWIEAE